MQIVTVDFETYYDKDFSLMKMATSAYVRDPRFHVHMMAIKVGDSPTEVWTDDTTIRAALASVDWSKSAVLAHNTPFDAFILTQHYGVTPAYYYDTLAMARAYYSWFPKLDLGTLLAQFSLGYKDRSVLDDMKGKLVLTEYELDRAVEYCKQDGEGCRKLFDLMVPTYPPQELDLIDLTTRLFCEPVLEVDVERAGRHLAAELTYRKDVFSKSAATLEQLSSADQFAAVLRSLGVEPELKISPRTKKPAYAFAKTDRFMAGLLEHPDPVVQATARARLAAKSTLPVTRGEAMVREGERGRLPVGYKYWGAHTGRWSGSNKINLQNLTRGGELRKSIVAPDGHVIVVSDSSQIEARITAYLADERKLLDDFRNMRPGDTEDVYTHFAMSVYNRPITKADEIERFLGKICILGLGYGMGKTKLRLTLANATPPIHLEEKETGKIVALYRRTFPGIPELWDKMERFMLAMVEGRDVVLDTCPSVRTMSPGSFVMLPSGMFIRYKDLSYDSDRDRFFYTSRHGAPLQMWGGTATENLAQALARQVVAEQMLEISRKYRVAMMTHDEVAAVVPEDDAEQAVKFITGVMSQPPSWAPDLPVAAEGKFAKYYSK